MYAGHLDRYVEVADAGRRTPGTPRGWGLSLLLDGLQASGRVDEALALTDDAMAAARTLGNPYFIAYAYWTSGSAHRHTDPDRALALWREGLDYVHQHRVDFFVGFIARDAARLRLVDADPDDALTMFDAAIDAFQQVGNVAQLTITLASATALFERIDRLDSAATLYAAIVRQPGSDHHVPDLPELAGRLVAKLGQAAFDAHGAEGAGMDLGDTAQFARREIQRRARRAPRARRRGSRRGPAGSVAARSTYSVSPRRATRPARSRSGCSSRRRRRTATSRTSTRRSARRTVRRRRAGRWSTALVD